jgi:Fe-S oxidoreductase
MAVDMKVFHQFLGQIAQLGARAQRVEMSPEDRVARAKAVIREGIKAEQAGDLESCMHCGLCAQACHFRAGTDNPRYTPARKFELAKRIYRREVGPFRWLYRLATREITVDDLMEAQELVFDSCTTCGRCTLICPMGINIAGLVTLTRHALANAGLIPDDLAAVEQEQGSRGTVFGAGPEHLKQALERLAENGLEAPLDKERADYLVLTSVVDLLLFNDQLASTVRLLNRLDLDWTFRSNAFEGANFGYLAGCGEVQRKATLRVIEEAVAIGAKAVIVPECGHAYPALRWEGANVYGKPLPFDVYAISEFIGLMLREGRLKLKAGLNGEAVTYHDPCKLGRHSGVFEEPREVLQALGAELHEMPAHALANWCCGGGAGLFVINRTAPLRRAAFEIKKQEVERTGADKVVMACGSCRLNFLKGQEDTGMKSEIVSLVALVGDNLDAETKRV